MTDPKPLTRAERRALDRSSVNRAPVYTGAFWLDLGERVVTSAAGGALAVATAQTFVLNDPVSWASLGMGAGTAALVSALKGIAASRVDTGSPSLAPSI